jgi:hypothetical protein
MTLQAMPQVQQQNSQLPTRPLPSPPPAPTEFLIDAVEKFVPEFLSNAWTQQRSKHTGQKRLELLFKGQLRLDDWNVGLVKLEDHLTRILDHDPDPEDWNSQLCFAIAPLVLAYADNALSSIFASDEWVRVRPRAGWQQGNVEDNEFSTSDKLREELLQSLESSKIKARIFEALITQALFGRVFGRVCWDEKKIPVFYRQGVLDLSTGQPMIGPDGQPIIDPSTGAPITDPGTCDFLRGPDGQPVLVPGEPERHEEIAFAHPKLELVQPDRILPDPVALDDDIQSWTGIGYITEITRSDIITRFDEGTYNLHYAEFEDQFPEGSGKGFGVAVSETGTDPDRSQSIPQAHSTYQEWEYHGQVPVEIPSQTGGASTTIYEELHCAYITNKGAETPAGGLLVKLWLGPALRAGYRPFVTAQFTQWGTEGVSAVQAYMDQIWLVSHLTNLLIDNLRLTVNAQHTVLTGSRIARLRASGAAEADKEYPGKWWEVDSHDDIKPFEQPPLPYGELFNALQHLEYQLQMATGVYTVRGGIERTEKTASEIHQVASQQDIPISNRLMLFIENFLDPCLTMALAAIQQNSLNGKQIAIKDSYGVEKYVELSEDEIRTGKYLCNAMVGHPDSMRLAQAQSLQQALQVLVNMAPIIQGEGNIIEFTPLVRSLLEKLNTERLKQIIHPMSPEEKMARQQQQMMQQMMAMQGVPPPGQGGPPGAPPPQGNPAGPGASPNGPPQPPPQGPMGPPPSDDEILNMLLQQQSADAEGRTFQR